ncbi:MAG: MFS transporter [Gammaproteobacteria bacterium]
MQNKIGMKNTSKMTKAELRAGVSLALVFFLRMFSLFLVLPVLAIYASEFAGATPILIGLALGIYGLSQALLQVPFGMLSDRWGRKPVIIMGLVIFACGSIIAGTADSIYMIIAGRTLQGAGAIASAVMALAADLTREEQRTKTMAIIGISVGAAFSLAFVAGPLLVPVIGVNGIFLTSAVLACVAIGILVILVPRPDTLHIHCDTELVTTQLIRVLKNWNLIRLDIGIFILHLVLMANFVVIPLALLNQAGIPTAQHWQVYLPVLFISAIIMFPFLILGERRKQVKVIFTGAVLLLMLSQLGLSLWHETTLQLALMMVVFFTAFNYMEAMLPSLISKTATVTSKGTALGVYSTSQFIGIFIGGLAGGTLYGNFGMTSVFLFSALIAACWLFVTLTMPDPDRNISHMIKLGIINQEQAGRLVERLSAVAGVDEAVVIAEDGIAYLKVDKRFLDYEALNAFISKEQ